jgi:hypothetical protein
MCRERRDNITGSRRSRLANSTAYCVRRSIPRLPPDEPVTGLQLEEALRILADLLRLEQRDRNLTELVAQL